jgi:uncharacterized membrane protein YjjB (DUF3815 family)
MCAGLGLWLVVMGGRTADVGWFRTKTDTFLNDVVVMDRYGYTMKHLYVLPAIMHMVPDRYGYTMKHLYVLPAIMHVVPDSHSFTMKHLHALLAMLHFLASMNPSLFWLMLDGS